MGILNSAHCCRCNLRLPENIFWGNSGFDVVYSPNQYLRIFQNNQSIFGGSGFVVKISAGNE